MRLGNTKVIFYIAIALLALSIVLAAASIVPKENGTEQSKLIIKNTFHLNSNEVRRQGIGNFHGQDNVTYLDPEIVTIKVVSRARFYKKLFNHYI